MEITKVTSKITGKTYDIYDAWYISNHVMYGAYLCNGGDEYLLDVLYDKSKEKNKMTFVFPKNEYMSELYDKWCKHELEY
nr:MAG TPA: hypothetical protein [Caudoviricetes sp.]